MSIRDALFALVAGLKAEYEELFVLAHVVYIDAVVEGYTYQADPFSNMDDLVKAIRAMDGGESWYYIFHESATGQRRAIGSAEVTAEILIEFALPRLLSYASRFSVDGWLDSTQECPDERSQRAPLGYEICHYRGAEAVLQMVDSDLLARHAPDLLEQLKKEASG